MRTNAAPTLRRMALEMQESGVSVWPIEELFRVMASVRGERGYAVEKLFSALVTQEVLLPVGETAARFAYHSIQSYFSAKALLALPDRERRLSRITDSLGSPLRSRWWEETLVITCGLLAADGKEAAMLTLQRLLEPIVYGSDLMEGETVFLAARCLLECQPVRETKGLQALIQHVVSALEWRGEQRIRT